MASALGALVVLLLPLQNTLPLRILTLAGQEFFLSWTLLLIPLLLKLLEEEIPDYAHVNPHSLSSGAGTGLSENMRPGRGLYTSTNQDTEKRVRNDLGC